jgi:cytochrome c oxidase subunit 2
MREILWTVIPAVVLLGIAVPSLKLLFLMDYGFFENLEDPNLSFKVVGHQWYWSYEYFVLKKDGTDLFLEMVNFDSYMLDIVGTMSILGYRLLEVDNPLYVPWLQTIRFLISSIDVIHAWAVPSAGIKVDAIPGRLSQAYAFFKRTGIFYGQCSEICGVNHGFMPIKLIVFNKDENTKL